MRVEEVGVGKRVVKGNVDLLLLLLMGDAEADEFFKPLETSRDEDEEALKAGDGRRSREETGWWNIIKKEWKRRTNLTW